MNILKKIKVLKIGSIELDVKNLDFQDLPRSNNTKIKLRKQVTPNTDSSLSDTFNLKYSSELDLFWDIFFLSFFFNSCSSIKTWLLNFSKINILPVKDFLDELDGQLKKKLN